MYCVTFIRCKQIPYINPQLEKLDGDQSGRNSVPHSLHIVQIKISLSCNINI